MTNGAEQTATAGATFARAHARLLADRSIQFDLPGMAPPRIPSWLKTLAHLFEAIAPALRYVFWGGLILLGVVILFVAARRIRSGTWRWPWRKAEEDEAGEEWRPAEAAARALLADADALAAQGRHAEAVHLLLQRSIEDIGGRRPGFVRPSLTSRDIAAAQALPPSARTAFAHITAVVERSLFGRAGVDREAWTVCRGAYADFAAAESWA